MAEIRYDPAETFTLTPTQVRHIRVSMGYTKVALAKRLGVTPQTIYNWENGLKPIGKDNAYRLATLAQSRGINYES